jgi:hypothetical protein
MNEFNKNEELKYQFVLYINDHIICQRYFNIIGFDEESVDSLQIKDLMETIAGVNLGTHGSLGIIPRYLQKKSLTYMWDNYNPYSTQQEENIKGISDRKDNFQFEIKVDEKTIAKTEFSGNLFPPKIRYAVDVREIIPAIMNEIRTSLSQKKYSFDSKTKAWRESQKEFLVK